MWQCWVSEPLFFSHSHSVASQQISAQDKAHPSSSNSLYLSADNSSCEKNSILLLLVTVALRWTTSPKEQFAKKLEFISRQYVSIFCVLCQGIAAAPCKDLRKSMSPTVLLLLSLLNKTNQTKMQLSWVQRHRGKGSFQTFSLLLQKNVKCVFCKTLSAWAKHLGCLEEVQWKQRISCEGKQAVVDMENGVLLSVLSRPQALGFSLANRGKMVKLLQF